MTKSKQIDIRLKPAIVFLSSLAAMGIFILSTLLATSVCAKWYGLIVGIALMIVAIPIHCQGKKSKLFYALSFLVNSVANGFSVSAYYISKSIALNVGDMLKACLLPVLILFLVYFIVQIFPKSKNVVSISVVVISCITLVALLVFWIRQGEVLFSFGFFAVLLSIFTLCVMGVTANNTRNVLRDISFGSFGAFVMISVVVLFILSEGEILEGFDVSGMDDGKKVKSKKNK